MTLRMGKTGITIFGCEKDEEGLFRHYSALYGIEPTIIHTPVSLENAVLAAGNRCISINHKTRITQAILHALKKNGVAYISTRSVGCNHIDLFTAQQMGIDIGNVAYSPDSVADYTIMLMLMALRNTKQLLHRVEEQNFKLEDPRGRELRDMTVGVLGTGRIGQAVIKRLSGFGCRVLAYDQDPSEAAEYVSLNDLLEQSDLVTLHTALTSATWHIIDPPRIERMKPGAWIINTGRGQLIDTEALVCALEENRLAGAALDVIEGEEGVFYHDWTNKPMENEFLSRLQQLPNVILTPHTAFYTEHALWDTVEMTLKNCLLFEGRKEKWIS